MSLTIRQQSILERIGAVEVRIKQTGTKGYSLQGEDVTTTMTSLIVREFVKRDAGGHKMTLTEAGRSAMAVFAD